ncbi:MAG: Serine/threonine-protein kinase PK-1 [Calditrichaeota bacterium]|nr:Serine/threonine-protein kinase PK-1 [Calditrichota bacterium]
MRSRMLARRLLPRVAAVIGIWVLVVLVINYVVMPLYTRRGSEINVPDLRGRPVTQARNLAGVQDFRISIEDERFVADTPQGVILEQFPMPGNETKPGRRIHVIVSSGVPTVEVPHVVSSNRDDALFRIESAGLVVDTIRYRFSDTRFEGLVIDQRPDSGEVVERRSGMELTISLGRRPREYRVPQVLDLPYEQARYLILKAGLQVGDVREDHFVGRRPGAVMVQSPPPRTAAEPGDRVDLVINRRPAPEHDSGSQDQAGGD